jgi:hypothetical protein
MKGFAQDLQRNTRDFTSMARLICVLALASTGAYGQVILDNFSSGDESHYTFIPVFSNPADGWAVTAGELHPSIDGNASATWLWNQGQKLSAIGDSVSISLALSAGANDGFPSSIGLFLAADVDSVGVGHEISQTTFGGTWSYSVDGAGQIAPTGPTGPVQLTIQRTGQTVDGFVYSTTFSGGGLPSPLTDFFIDPANSLMFGPFAYNTTGASAALDNLTFTAVPEPSMYAAAFGLLALTTALIRNRLSKA